MIHLHELKPAPGAVKQKRRLGRGPGSGRGKTSGRGQKGQKAYAGHRLYVGFEGGQMPLHRRLPKRGFHNPFRKEYQIINLDQLEEKFEDGAVITPHVLFEKRLIHSLREPVKILARGDLKKALTVRAHAFSKKAKEKIESAGGKVEVMN